MPASPSLGQIFLLLLAIALFGLGGVISLTRLRGDGPKLRRWSGLCLYGGIIAAVALLLWHSLARGNFLPIGDNFDALVWLAVLLALFVGYTQARRPIRGLDWFVMPIVLLLLVLAGHFGAAKYHSYRHDLWMWVHSATAYGGALAFAVAAATGAMYVLTARNLRRKRAAAFGSLERLEHLTMVSVTLGFALLTIGMVTGFVYWRGRHQHMPVAKVWLSVLAWAVYAVVLHAPINPRFRGRRVAILSMLGFGLMVGTLIAVQFMAGGRRP